MAAANVTRLGWPMRSGAGALKIGASRTWLRARWDDLCRLSLAVRFMLLHLVVVAISVVVTAAWVCQEIQSGVLDRTGSVVALFVDSIISPHLRSLATDGQLSGHDKWALVALTREPLLTHNVVAFKVWAPDGTVIFSSDPRGTGLQFLLDDDLARAFSGQVSSDLSDLRAPENIFERDRWTSLVQVYAPVRDEGGRIFAVTEVYQLPDQLEAQLVSARWQSWGVVGGIGIVMYLTLAGLVKRGSDTIERQEIALHDKVAQLSGLLTQNARLHDRVRQAASRTITLNEQTLKRISADLHDGPSQALALALLRLDVLRAARTCSECSADAETTADVNIISQAIQGALRETRAISAGLRLPELSPLGVQEVAERIVSQHTRQTGTAVALSIEDVPAHVSVPIKIALHRSLQEALSNATRHGCGIDVQVAVWSTSSALHLRISDAGPGFADVQGPEEGHLGLVGMRERAELLEGGLEIFSGRSAGTSVHVWWPLTTARAA
ncbi:MAG: sensor histidine kinase [Chloroflexota bacterium]